MNQLQSHFWLSWRVVSVQDEKLQGNPAKKNTY